MLKTNLVSYLYIQFALTSSDLCKVLLGFHALKGCDSTSGFAIIGEVKFFKFLKKHPAKYSSVSKLGNQLDVSELMLGIEQFICHTHDNKATIKEVNECRYRMFCQKRAANEALPPTLDSLLYHTKGCNFQALVWNIGLEKTFDAQPEIPCPIENGREYEEDLDGGHHYCRSRKHNGSYPHDPVCSPRSPTKIYSLPVF